MARWMKPTEESPQVEVGDRIVIIVMERRYEDSPIEPHLVILERSEGGWDSCDTVFSGYNPYDGVLWAHEKDICQIARVVT
jgi:hypothetical protein